MRACQRQLNSYHRVIVYDDSTSTLCPPSDSSLVDVLVSRLADSSVNAVLLDGNDLYFVAMHVPPVFLLAFFKTSIYPILMAETICSGPCVVNWLKALKPTFTEFNK